MKKSWALILVVVFVFLGTGLSFRSDRVAFFVREDSPKPFPVRLELLQPLKANADRWGFVRQSATWARGNSLFMDDLIFAIRKAFPLGTTVNITLSDQLFNGQSYTLRLKLNSGNVSYQPSTLGAAASYTNFFELRSTSDNQPALQFFFDDDPRDVAGDGAVLLYQLSRLDPTRWSGATAIIESYVVQPVITGFPNQGLIQTYSWKGPLGSDTLGQDVDTGRVILEEMDNRTVFCFKSVVSFNGTTDLVTINAGTTALGYSHNNGLCPGTGREYYKLAYSQKLDGSLNVTAKGGLEQTAITSGQAITCNNNVNQFVNFTPTYGLFNFNGFVAEGVAASAIPSDFIQANRVDGLYDRVGTVGKSSATTSPAGSSWDTLTKAYVDAITIHFENVP
ncbi:LIC_12337 family protein [Leptospira borgpetersenii]|uniref:Uncharacterized protein n=1 Tax=Leptospira borgpetersenii serovar Ballum TaxID=280505 RepID=A0A0E3B0P3_LEPBO|nr:hypothetical protein [Leptospira borgpetersenii]EMO10712.1 hypothetical protein LEP1GSC137_3793 [Leptospira borgpetersenii str. Noumea 25]ALO26825.1 hypothetical protein LBBP_02596 [Leptospira borgpetersenii serovar Ballum]ANH01345.1 Uncharacterized protein LB4E_2053 [Leptospira borgpetersenii str. 4E]EKR01401.1 hypothetical protein LEP1GSC121_2822 [Leptospira borgpetersenii serovar Castellonis str. 200801910]KGE23075.1 hypothetical protein IQ66_13415 [Leptospira borgpetersenii serovar Ball